MFSYVRIHVCAAAPCNIANSNNAAGTACACNAGFRGTITWNGATASGTCTRTQCTGSHANAPANGAVTKTSGDNHGSRATFSCNAGFRLNDAMPITCDAASADAAWPAPNTTPQCTRTLLNISLSAEQTHTRTDMTNHALYGLLLL